MLRHGRLLLAALALAGCHGNAPHTVRGETVLLGGAEVWSWVNVDTEGQVYELGVTLPMLAIDALTDGTTLRLGLPPEASQTFVDHVVLAYEAKGHGPAAYRAAQLDVRYFGVSRAVQEAIDCRSEERPAEIPAPFTLEAPLECAPGVVRAQGWIVRLGRSIAFLEGRLLNAAGDVVATCTSTAKMVPKFCASKSSDDEFTAPLNCSTP